MTEKDKIVDIILIADVTERTADNIADALIENGIGDIAEWKARAEVAERALKNVIKQYKRCDELGACEECSERQGCVKALCDKYKQQAEKEIEEERK